MIMFYNITNWLLVLHQLLLYVKKEKKTVLISEKKKKKITSLEVKERRDSEELPIIITLSPTSDDEPSVMLTKVSVWSYIVGARC